MIKKPTVSKRLVAADLSVGFPSRPAALKSLSISIPDGKIVVIAGPNGCGKSTLLRALARLIRPANGAVLLDGTDVQQLTSIEMAQRLGMLPQGAAAPEGMLVRELVALGRYPFQHWWQTASAEDGSLVLDAMRLAGVLALAERTAESLSGGERQRAWIGMVLAQQTSILLLDEPTTYLDMAHQLDVLELLEQLNRQQGKTIVIVLHDLNHAARLADHLVLMRDGVIVVEGSPAEIMTVERIAQVFDVEVELRLDTENGKPTCVPLRVIRP
ncbi:ABC-type Fe3+-siderophore transport system, ATPase component [Acidisarcina polymorpha]|uniref:ABC-type Fe3+-siderophore transport system, ATPase component n=1 Tax=Acidisarcina polymorpha TaxID=2211140 RepID=A0A2Z5G4J1_9BACT|nr:ABC transporter ATP-binding protein [Acidisarcina polymorpha]AXC13991.1 ABC-type Fe3+-siderophore transport system, ATPase component [Acidisarcina polymorpha]